MEPVEAPDVVEEPFSPVDFTLAQRRVAKGNAVLGLDDDPEKAARALQLSKATGVHPSVVFGDLDNFDKQHKAALTDAIVSDNPYLQEYLSQWPLAPKVSNDDYGNLDALTEALNKFSTQSHLAAAIDGYHANVASDKPKREGGLMQTVPQFAAMMATPEGRNQLWEGLKKYPAEFVKGMVEATKLPAEIMPGGSADIATEEGMGQAINLAMLLALGRATRLSKTGVTSGGGMGWQSGLDTHVAAGREPPVGLNPVVDEIKGRQADLDAERFGEAFKAANATTTRERSPEMLAEYARIHGDEKIGIPADVIRELYGDKQPESGDGVLGWGVKPEQLELAEAAGADVEVPVAHALAFMEPEVYQQIKDHIRFRDGGVSKEEAKGLKELEAGREPEEGEAKPSSPVDTIRKAAGLGKQLELDVTRMEDRPPFDKGPGMPKTTYERYQRLIEKQQEEDAAYALKREQEAARKRQSEEWRKNAASVRAEVVRDVQSLPVHQVDEVLRTENVRIDPASLPEGVTVPKRYLRQGGYALDDLATHYGFDTGREMAMQLSALDSARGKMQPMEFTRRLISEETARRMEANYGDRAANALEEAKEHVLSPTQIDILAEEVIQLAEQAKQQLPIKTDALLSQVREKFAQMPIGEVSSKKLLAAAGKAGRYTELALLNAEPTEAFIQKQRQWLATMMAKEAVAYEKARGQFDRLAKGYRERPLKDSTTTPEYVNFIQDLLMRVGEKVNRTAADLASEIELSGYKSLSDFVTAKEHAPSGDYDIVGRDLHVPEWLQQPSFRKPLDELTVDQFNDLHRALKAMAFAGRDDLKVERAGAKVDLRNLIDNEFVPLLKSLGKYPKREDREPYRVTKWAKAMGWSGITTEKMFNRIDRNDPRGAFNQAIVRPFTEASVAKDALVREYDKKLRALEKPKDIDALVENSVFMEPGSGDALVLRRRNVLGVLQHIGNADNLKQLAKSWDVEPESVLSFVFRNVTKEDVDRAQAIGNLFNELIQKADRMSHQVSGVGIKKIPLAPIETPFGTYEGWYSPIERDRRRPGESKKLIGRSPDEEGYFRATTSQAYTKERTGSTAAVKLGYDVIGTRMNQMIHDIAWRPTILQLSKIFYDPKFNRAMIDHAGEYRAGQLIPFLRDMAKSANYMSHAASIGEEAVEFMRQNTIGTLIGLNPGTVMKHGTTALANSIAEVGGLAFAQEFGKLIYELPGKRGNWNMAMEKSEELQRRYRSHFQDIIRGHGTQVKIAGSEKKFDTFREFMLSAGATPVSLADLASAVPTWLVEYKRQMAEGADEGMARFLADRAVRNAHGSSSQSNKPQIMRTGSIPATFSSLYGFFSHIMNKHYDLMWKAKDLASDTFGKGSGDLQDTKRHIPDLIKGFIYYVAIPVAIEEAVSPYINSHKDSGLTMAAKATMLGLSSGFLYLRDALRAVVNATDPQVGLMGASFKGVTDLSRDLQKRNWNNETKAKMLRHSFTLIGIMSGLTNTSEGRLAEYMYRVSTGMEKPKDIPDWLWGMWHGTQKSRRNR